MLHNIFLFFWKSVSESLSLKVQKNNTCNFMCAATLTSLFFALCFALATLCDVLSIKAAIF